MPTSAPRYRPTGRPHRWWPPTCTPPRSADEKPPSRRERRKAKRRERRLARGRRLITVRTLLFVILLAALVVAGLAAIRWYDTNSYFVGVENNELIIYQGRIGGFLWYNPVVVKSTGVTTADVPANYVHSLQSGVEETSVADAENYVANLGRPRTATEARRRLTLVHLRHQWPRATTKGA